MISLLRNRNRNDNDNGVNDNDSKDNDSDNENDSNFIVPTDKLASRVGASLLKSAISNNNKSGLSSSSSSLSNKLIVSTMKEYEDTMVQCARENSNTDSNTDSNTNFSSFRQQLLDNLHTAPLWDTKRWVQNLETGLTEMVNIRQQLKHKHEHFCDDDMDIYVVDENDDDDDDDDQLR